MTAPEPRTSAAQLRAAGSLLGRTLKGLWAHILRLGLLYGFILGTVCTLLTLAALIWYGVFAYPLPWKVTDPADPRFNPAAFRFSDYENSSTLTVALRAVFPVGTSKADIDAALLPTGVRFHPYTPRKRAVVKKNLYYYTYSNLRCFVFAGLYFVRVDEVCWKAAFYFDSDDTLTRVVGVGP